MKKGIVLLLISILLIIGSFYLKNHFSGSPNQITQVEADVLTYLMSEQGYTEDDILFIEGEYGRLADSVRRYHAKVYFRNEPQNWYLYTYNETEQIYLYGYLESGQHVEEMK